MNNKKIIGKQSGFTLVELMVTMVVFTLTIVAAANIFSSLLGQFKMQTKIAETNIEGLVGLQMLKADVEQAGFGIPWNLSTANYDEAVNSGLTTWDDTAFNDAGATDNPPRGIVYGDGGVIANPPLNGSDVLVVKSTNVGLADAAQRWTYVRDNGGALVFQPYGAWTDPQETFLNNENVIVIKPVSGPRLREVIVGGGNFFTTITQAAAPAYYTLGVAAFEPVANTYDTYILYGVTPSGTTPRMPFNRADYYVKRPGTMPTACSNDAGTGVLYKAVVNHPNGQLTELPLLDCVREMRIVFGRDTDNDGDADTFGDLPTTLTAEEVRDQLKEVRIYILAHEGQRDPGYQSDAVIAANDPDVGNVISFNAGAANLRNFRWKIYTILTRPYNIRGS